jgi:hypothetical protein
MKRAFVLLALTLAACKTQAPQTDVLDSVIKAEQEREVVSKERYVDELAWVSAKVNSGTNPTYDDPIFKIIFIYAQSMAAYPRGIAANGQMHDLANLRDALSNLIFSKANCKADPGNRACVRFNEAARVYLG